MHLRCPHCQNQIEIADVPTAGEITCAGCGSSFQLASFSTATWDGPAKKRIGKFEILSTVGHGAFGTVHKAHDTELDRTVAIKVPRASNIGPGPEDLDRFLREARSVAQLRFPSIIAIHEVGTDNGVPYLVSDFVEGITLADHLSGRGFSVAESAKLVADVADALQYAHSLGVVHRDVKPSNIMIRPDGSPCVMDFGLAKRDAGEITMTIDGQILGTPAYMSPEQARGEGHQVDGRSDVYSLGVILYQLLTNELPFRGNKSMLLHQVLHDEPKSPRSLNDKIPRDLETIALKAMAKEPGRRYASAKELAEDLRRWLTGEPILARPVGIIERTWRWAKRKPAVAAMSAALVAVILIAFGVGAWQLDQTTTALALATKREQERDIAQKDRALAQIKNLLEVAPAAVPTILKELEANRDTVLPRLRELYAVEKDRLKRMRVALALLPVEPDKVRDDLAAWLLDVNDPAEVLLLRDELTPHASNLPEAIRARVLTEVLQDRDGKRFAAFIPLLISEKAQFLPGLVTELDRKPAPPPVEKEIFKKEGAIAATDPKVKGMPAKLFEVTLEAGVTYKITLSSKVIDSFLVLQDEQGKQLAEDDDSGGNQDSLIEFTPTSTQKFKVHAAALQEGIADRSKAGPFVLTITQAPAASSSDDLASRQANAALALLRLNHPERVWPLLKHTPDPTVASLLIDRLASRGVELPLVLKRLENEPDESARRVLILSLAEFGDNAWLAGARADAVKKMQALYLDADDPGIHAASEWLLRQWKEDAWLREQDDAWRKDAERRAKRLKQIGDTLAKEPKQARRAWYVNGQGQTMVVIPGPVEFTMGSPRTEKDRFDHETQHRKRINRSFALAAKPVTVAEYRRFDPSYTFTARSAPEPDCPIISVSWYQAAAYCNWLSKQEGIPQEQWVYETDKKGQIIKLRENYLSLTGYRLPTEAEWEYACRADSSTSRAFGNAEELLGKYAWYLHNSSERSWPVGSKRPNNFGFFDLHGNVWNWCQEEYRSYPASNLGDALDDKEYNLGINNQTNRLLRGGSFINQASNVRSSLRLRNAPTYRYFNNGFRPSRTLSLAAFTALPPSPEGGEK